MPNKKLEIGIVTQCIDNRQARGTALVARRLVENLKTHQQEFNFTLIHQDKVDDPIYQDSKQLFISNIKFPFGRAMLNEAIFWLKQRVFGQKFDIVHYLQPRVWPSYILTNARHIICTPHDAGVMLDIVESSLANRVFRFTNRYLHQRMSKLMVVSEFAKQEVSKYFNYSLDNIFVIHNGIDDDFKYFSEDKDKIKKYLNNKYNIPTSKYILSVGRLDPHKNILNLLEAYSKVWKNHQDTKLVIVGGKHIPDYDKQVFDLISKLDLEDKVLISDYIEQADLPKVYQSAELLVNASLHEGFGLPLLEAMATSVPIVCSQSTSLPEVAQDAALTFDPNNIDDIADKIDLVLRDNDLRQKLIKRGKERIKDFSWAKATDKLIGEYRKFYV